MARGYFFSRVAICGVFCFSRGDSAADVPLKKMLCFSWLFVRGYFFVAFYLWLFLSIGVAIFVFAWLFCRGYVFSRGYFCMANFEA